MSPASTTALRDAIAAYAARVRTALADLPSDTVDDLTDGLEADLEEAFIEHATTAVPGAAPGIEAVEAQFGSPQEYASELRSSAGIAPASPVGKPSRNPVTRLRAWASRVWESTIAPLTTTPLGRWFVELMRDLRPAWWVIRAWLIAAFTARLLGMGYDDWFLPRNAGEWLVMTAAVLLSVQLGRGRLTKLPRAAAVATIVNVAAVIAIFVTAASVSNAQWRSAAYPGYTYTDYYYEADPVDGVWMDSRKANNLYVYDAEGNPVLGARIFSEWGGQLTISGYNEDFFYYTGVTQNCGYIYDRFDQNLLVPTFAKTVTEPDCGAFPFSVDSTGALNEGSDDVTARIDWPYPAIDPVGRPLWGSTTPGTASPTPSASTDTEAEPSADASLNGDDTPSPEPSEDAAASQAADEPAQASEPATEPSPAASATP